MRRLIPVILSLALSAGWLGPPTWAQDIRINPVPPQVKPQWVPVPGDSQVYYAPNLPTDVFRYRGKYFFYWNGYLYQSKSPKGPWKYLSQVPAFFYKIDPAYFKTLKKGETLGPPAAGAPPGPSPGPSFKDAPAPPQPAPGAPEQPLKPSL